MLAGYAINNVTTTDREDGLHAIASAPAHSERCLRNASRRNTSTTHDITSLSARQSSNLSLGRMGLRDNLQ